jgi:hypothetical protein
MLGQKYGTVTPVNTVASLAPAIQPAATVT